MRSVITISATILKKMVLFGSIIRDVFGFVMGGNKSGSLDMANNLPISYENKPTKIMRNVNKTDFSVKYPCAGNCLAANCSTEERPRKIYTYIQNVILTIFF